MNIKEKWVWLIYLWINMRHDWVLKYWWPMNVLSYIVETSRFPWNIVHKKRDMKVSLLNTCTWRMTFSKNWAWNGISFPLCYPLKLCNIFQSKEICRCSSLLFSWSFSCGKSVDALVSYFHGHFPVGNLDCRRDPEIIWIKINLFSFL